MKNKQQGVFLLEALLAVLVFSAGILALVAMGASAMNAQNDAQYRMEASNYTSDITSQIWLSASRVPVKNANGDDVYTVVTADLKSFEHQTTTGANCSFKGTASTNPLVTAWLAKLKANSGLPGNDDSMVQIEVDTRTDATADKNKITVTVCWQTPSDTRKRSHSLTSYVN